MKSKDIIQLHLTQKLDVETIAMYYRQPIATVRLILEQGAIANPAKFAKADSPFAKIGMENNKEKFGEALAKVNNGEKYDPQSLELNDEEHKEKKLGMFLIIENIALDDSDDNKTNRLKAAKFCFEELIGRNERKVASTSKLAANTLLAYEVGKLNQVMELANKDRELLDAPILDVLEEPVLDVPMETTKTAA